MDLTFELAHLDAHDQLNLELGFQRKLRVDGARPSVVSSSRSARTAQLRSEKMFARSAQ